MSAQVFSIESGRKPDPITLPPHDLDAEASVLSACMIGPGDSTNVARIRDFLRPEHFYSEANRRTFEAVLDCVDAGKPPDMVGVLERLKVSNRLAQVGGFEYLAGILDAAPAIVNLVHYAEIVHNRWRERQVIAVAQRIAATGYLGVPDTQAYADGAVESLAVLARAGFGRDVESNLDALRRIVHELMTRASNPASATPGLTTGIEPWDTRLGGLHPGEVTTLVGRPGMGKTSLALQVAVRTAQAGIGVLFFVQDMSRDDLLVNALCHLANVDSQRWRQNRLAPADWQRVTPACETFAKLPLAIDDTRELSAPQLRARALTHADRSMRRSGVPLGLVVVDYVQQLTAPPELAREKAHEVIAFSAKAIKSLAREMGVAVLELAQQKRSDGQRGRGENAGHKRPELSDIAGSSRIEAESDAVVFIVEGEEHERELVFRKVRRGECFDVGLAVTLGSSRFEAA
jgi:replicative DNA helicase